MDANEGLPQDVKLVESGATPVYVCQLCGDRIPDWAQLQQHIKSSRHDRNRKIHHVQQAMSRTQLSQGALLATFSAQPSADKSLAIQVVDVRSESDGRTTTEVRITAPVQSQEGDHSAVQIGLKMLLQLPENARMKATLVVIRKWIVIIDSTPPKVIMEEPLEIGLGDAIDLDLPLTLSSRDRVGVTVVQVLLHYDQMIGDEKKDEVTVSREIKIIVGNERSDGARPKSHFQQSTWQQRQAVAPLPTNHRIVPADPLPHDQRNQLQLSVPLPHVSIPLELRLLACEKFDAKALPPSQRQALTELNETLSVKGDCGDLRKWTRKMAHLLYIEELQAEAGMRQFDMAKVPVRRCTRNPRLFEIDVPGLAENRPSLLQGDRIYLKPTDESSIEYESLVYRINRDTVWIGLGRDFDRLQDQIRFRRPLHYSVRFDFGRGPLRMCHRAITNCEQYNPYVDVLFPKLEKMPHLEDEPLLRCPSPLKEGEGGKRSSQLRWHSERVGRNPEQSTAVREILSGRHRPAPYILFGPPGTGKTFTIVEAVKQIYTQDGSSRILCCAASNSAADLMCSRLFAAQSSGQSLDKKHVMRLNALSRKILQLPEALYDCSNIYPKGSAQPVGFWLPSVDEIGKLRIIVTTLCTAGRLVSSELPIGHFSHIFVDEAGQATEPETLVPLAGMVRVLSKTSMERQTQVVLAGDPNQLGAIVQSVLAIDKGLGTSMLERLMLHGEIYKKNDSGQYDKRVLTKLVRNYRSHPALIKLPSRLFYDDELVAGGSRDVIYSRQNWSELPKKGVPLIMEGVIGEEHRQESSPSWFNPIEIAAVLKYVDHLLRDGGAAGKDIGIITPYRMQADKLKIQLDRDARNTPDYSNVAVGTVEAYQGAERRIIIISTVRSQVERLQVDREYKLGFVKQPKRFNTAMTRAKALLIVVGNPFVLRMDYHWKSFLEYCLVEGCYTGVKFSPDDLERCGTGDAAGDVAGGGGNGNLGELERMLKQLGAMSDVAENRNAELSPNAEETWD